jgi:hypothetical protein
MDTQAIRAQMPTLVRGHVPSNVRSFKFNIFDGQPKVSTLGFHIDPKPFEGKVIATTDEAIVIKTGRAEFAVLDKALVTDVPDEGAKVQVEPYARRRFDGLRADTPEESTEFTADGQPYTVKRLILGSAPAKLPIPEPQCPELQELVHQLEQLPAPEQHHRQTAGHRFHRRLGQVPGTSHRALRTRPRPLRDGTAPRRRTGRAGR